MQISVAQRKGPGIVYRVACQNRGCGHTFDLWITAKEAGMLAGTIACPRCRRHGGMLKPAGRLGDKVSSAKLVFKLAAKRLIREFRHNHAIEADRFKNSDWGDRKKSGDSRVELCAAPLRAPSFLAEKNFEFVFAPNRYQAAPTPLGLT